MEQPINNQLCFGQDFVAVRPFMKLSEFADGEFLPREKHHKKQSSYNRDLTALKTIKLALGDRPLESLTPRDIEEYQAIRALRVKASTVNRDMETLRHMLNKAVEWGFLCCSPASKVKQLRTVSARDRFLSEDERERLLDECSDNVMLYGVVLAALETGMRRGELMNLKWQDVDLSGRWITLNQTKNYERRRIPISNRLSPVLEALHDFRQGEYVFAKSDGRPYGEWKRSFKSACLRAGIKDFRFHDLRHTFASWLAMRKVSIRTIQVLLGHKDIKMTMRYAHLADDHLREAVNGMGPKKSKRLGAQADGGIRTLGLRFTKALTFEDGTKIEIAITDGTAPSHRLGERNAVEREETESWRGELTRNPASVRSA